MKTLLKYRDEKYFEERQDHYFIFEGVGTLRCSKIKYDKGFWFTLRTMSLKATTTPCVSLNDIDRTKVMYRNHPDVKGIVGGYGLIDSPYVYVFWGQVPFKESTYNFCTRIPNSGKPLGFPNAFEDLHNLIVID